METVDLEAQKKIHIVYVNFNTTLCHIWERARLGPKRNLTRLSSAKVEYLTVVKYGCR